MTQLYQMQNLITKQNKGEPDFLPEELEGLSDKDLANLSWIATKKFEGYGFFPVVVYDLKLAKETALASVFDIYERYIKRGFVFEIEKQVEILQMRQYDLINWLVFKDACDDMIAAGLGDSKMQLAIRTTANNRYFVTANEGRAIMIEMRTFGSLMLSQLWAKKDQANAAESQKELEAVYFDNWISKIN